MTDEGMDPCVVETAPLCSIVQEFVTDWLKHRRSRRGQRGYDAAVDVDVMSPYAWLAFDSGVPESSIRKLRSPRRYPLTELRVADRITSSIGDPSLFYDGTLNVAPNPLVPATASAECCGGSERVVARVPDGLTAGMVVRVTATRVRATTTVAVPESIFADLRAFAQRF